MALRVPKGWWQVWQVPVGLWMRVVVLSAGVGGWAVAARTHRWQCHRPWCLRMRMVMGSKCRPHPGQVKACSFQIGTLAADRGLLSFRRAIGGW